MPSTDRLLIQVVPQLKPGRCGVTDHATALAAELESAFNIKTAFIVLNSTEPADLPYSRINCAPSELPKACRSLSNGQPATLLLHYSGYGYSADGAPVLLPKVLGQLHESGQFQIWTYFHELFATGKPWKASFWYSHRQRNVVRGIARISDLIVTNVSRNLAWLEREGMTAAPLVQLPVFSSVGESRANVQMNDRAPVLVVFGLPSKRREAYQQLAPLGRMLSRLGVKEIIDIGSDFDSPKNLSGIPVKKRGLLAAADISGVLSESMFGFVAHPSYCLAKSTIFAAYCASGTMPVIAESFSEEVDGLKDGVHVVSPGTVDAALNAGLDHCAAAASRWYLGHRLHVHAETYAQKLALDADEQRGVGAKSAPSILLDRKPLTVAICIGTFNQVQYLKDCIDSVFAQTYPIQEIWVSDDASSDETDQVMKKICARSPIVHYYRQPKNLGLSRNLSWVLAKPKTDLVVRLDSDDRLEPDYVKVLAELMAKYPEAGFAHSDVFEMNGRGERTRVRRLSRTSEFESAEEALRKSATGFRVAANCLLFRGSALAQAQYYLPTPDWSAGEDWRLCIRLAANGWGNVYAPVPLTNYRQWEDALNTRASRIVGEIANLRSIYEDTLMPEYAKRGWGSAVLKKHMRSRAIGFATSLDSPVFGPVERESYKARLRELGDSFSLSVAIFLAEAGFNPILRTAGTAKVRLKDQVKALLRRIKAPAGDLNYAKPSRIVLPARTDEDSR